MHQKVKIIFLLFQKLLKIDTNHRNKKLVMNNFNNSFSGFDKIVNNLQNDHDDKSIIDSNINKININNNALVEEHQDNKNYNYNFINTAQIEQELNNVNNQKQNNTENNKEENKNIHSGHRQRVREKFLSHPEQTNDTDLIELLLFTIIPRTDTRQMAVNLINKFGNIHNIFNADIEEINNCGVNGHSLKYIFQLIKIINQKC